VSDIHFTSESISNSTDI